MNGGGLMERDERSVGGERIGGYRYRYIFCRSGHLRFFHALALFGSI